MSSKIRNRHGDQDQRRRSRSSSSDSNDRRRPTIPRFMPDSEQSNPIFRRDQERERASNPEHYGYSSGRSTRLQDYTPAFVQKVPLNQHQLCQQYLHQHPEVLEERDLHAMYIDPAITLLATGNAKDKTLAWNYMEKVTLIKLIRTYQQAKRKDFLELFIAKDGQATADFKAIFTSIRDDCERKAGSPSREDDDLPARMRKMDVNPRHEPKELGVPSHKSGYNPQLADPQNNPYRSSHDKLEGNNAGRHSAGPGSQPLTHVQSTPRNHRDPSERRDSLNDHPSPGQGNPRGPATVKISDERFKRLPPREWRYFKAGRVFAVMTFREEYSKPSQGGDDYSMEGVRTARGTEVTEKVRRMVVVKTRDGFCLAVPINTYGGLGLNKPSFREGNINSHARIHMDDQQPSWLKNEPKTGKVDIAVRATDQDQELHPASRICFERTHSIDYNERIMKIGTVTEGCLPYLLNYWKEESNRPDSHGQRPRSSTVPDPTPDQARAERHSEQDPQKKYNTYSGRGGRGGGKNH